MASSWSVPPVKFIDEVEKALVDRIRTIAIDTADTLIDLSPVRTGRYRNNHIISFGAPDNNPRYQHNDLGMEVYDRSGGQAKLAARASLASVKPYQIIYFQTNLSYSLELENGKSGQAPDGIYGPAFIYLAEKYK